MAKMDFDNEVQLEVACLQRNNRGEFIIVKEIRDGDSNELHGVDIRKHFTNEGGDHVPTSKGIRIPTWMLKDLKEALDRIEVPNDTEKEE